MEPRQFVSQQVQIPAGKLDPSATHDGVELASSCWAWCIPVQRLRALPETVKDYRSEEQLSMTFARLNPKYIGVDSRHFMQADAQSPPSPCGASYLKLVALPVQLPDLERTV
jgi:hypothetical protein